MKNYWIYLVLVLVLVIIIGFIFVINKKSNLNPDYQKTFTALGEGMLNFTDPELKENFDLDFKNKTVTKNLGDNKTVSYNIVDVLTPFNIDNVGDDEYPFLMDAKYPDGKSVAYLVIARHDSNDKYVSLDSVAVGDPIQIDSVHEYNSNEVVIEAHLGEGEEKQSVHLAYTFTEDKITPGASNVDLSKPIAKPETKKDDDANAQKKDSDTGSGGAGKVALTFDDGPGKSTPDILDVLKDNNVKATFFIIGENAEGKGDLVKRVHNEGHLIGNHTYDHKDLSKLSYDAQKDEIVKTNNIINNLIGISPHYLRPPYGNYNDDTKKVLSDLGMEKMLWNVDTRDWSGLSSSEIYSRATANIKDGSIILMHDGVANSVQTAAALPDIIKFLKDHNFTMVKVSEL